MAKPVEITDANFGEIINPTKVNDVVQTRKWPNAIVPYVFESGFGKQTIPNLEGFILHFLFIH